MDVDIFATGENCIMKPHRHNPQTNMKFWVEHPVKEKKSYSQDWHSYNLSQTSEKLMAMSILNELCQYVGLKEEVRRGRPRLNVREMIYSMGLLIYNGKSSRRTISELYISKEKGYISQIPHFNTILNYFNNKELKQKLIQLITLASLPLKSVEQDFAVDSTGFTTSVFGRWFEQRTRQRENHRLWRKAHVMSGVKTNIITSIIVAQGTTADTVMFPELVDQTSKNFELREVSADLAYSSRKNLEAVSQKGGIAFIPFKKNATGKSKGTMLWRTMFKYFQENYDEYMLHYHKRSNVETVFSMIKRKFGNHLRCKNPVAQDNEILCKVLCHNIVVLIHELFELGIDISFDEHAQNMNFCANENPAQLINE